MMKKNLIITKQKLLLVEGQDEVNFFNIYLKHLRITDVQVVEVKGKDQFRNEFPALLNNPGFDTVTSYALIRDADNSAENAFKSISNILKKNDKPAPQQQATFIEKDGVSVGIFIIPGDKKTGMLETLCLESVAETSLMQKVDMYVDEADKLLPDEQKIKNRDKAKIQTYLAGQSELVNTLGIGTKKGYWNLDHAALDNLKEFLQHFS